MRLDKALVGRGLAPSRTRAAKRIRQGHVQVDARIVTNPAGKVGEGQEILVLGSEPQWVSRGAYKLIAGLDAFAVDPAGMVCIDLGAATGGFTEVLLNKGAGLIFSVDAGHGQLDPSLQGLENVVSLEKTNARDLNTALITRPVDLVVSDLSFISLKLGLPAGLDLLTAGGALVALIKPQFEVGKGNLGKNGVVKNPEQHRAVCEDICRFLTLRGFTVRGLTESPLSGPKGNKEFLVHATKNA